MVGRTDMEFDEKSVLVWVRILCGGSTRGLVTPNPREWGRFEQEEADVLQRRIM